MTQAIPTPEGMHVNRIAWFGDGSRLLVSGPTAGSGRSGIWDPVRGKGRELTRTGWSPTIPGDWDISTDALMVAIPNHDPLSAKIRTFPLDGSQIDMPERTVIPQGLRDLRGLVWAADGRGWYVCARTPTGWTLSFVDLEGRSRELLQLPNPTTQCPLWTGGASGSTRTLFRATFSW
jgi:hypothetical protein